MKKKVKIAALVVGLLLAQGATVWGQDRQTDELLLMRQYQFNLKRIPKTLPPEQRYILEERFKHQMMYERWKRRALCPDASSTPMNPTKNP
jgi:hypothetical protein